LGNSFWHNPEFLLSGPDYLAGGVFPAWLPAELGFEGTERFVERFQEVYGRRPSFLEGFAHDALALLHYLVLDVQVSSRAGLRDAIEQLEGVEGATGELRFAGDHAGQQRPFLLMVTSEGFAPL
jgi:ABC-type branched-subunit amino acid transport system substrate-binding protein